MQQLQPIADEAGLSLAQLAVAWVLQNDNVSAAIIGASRPEQVTENVKAAGVKLDAEALEADRRGPRRRRRARPGQDEVAEPRATSAAEPAGSGGLSLPRAGSSARRPHGRPRRGVTWCDAVLDQVAPDLADPGLRVALRGEAAGVGRGAPPAGLDLGARLVLEAPAPARPSGTGSALPKAEEGSREFVMRRA